MDCSALQRVQDGDSALGRKGVHYEEFKVECSALWRVRRATKCAQEDFKVAHSLEFQLKHGAL